MRWRGEEGSSNIEDRRGMSGGKKALFGGGAIGIVVVLLSLFTGKDLSGLLNFIPEQAQTTTTVQPRALAPGEEDTTAQLVSIVLRSTEKVWSDFFKNQFNETYEQPNLVMFEESTQSGCGGASSSMGPFYCPMDKKVYIDLGFCDELRTKFKAPGSFAIAYVVAHEVAHHVQNLTGISGKVQEMRSRLSEAEYNKFSVKLELQADYLAGAWAYHANQMRNILEPGDLQVAMTAANAIGDDKLQKEAMGYTVPDAFTHGTSEQRMRWFKRGFETGDLMYGLKNYDNFN